MATQCTGSVTSISWNPPSINRPLQVCQGDCDRDSDCAPGLYCQERGSQSVPGCTGWAPSGWDYCVCRGPTRSPTRYPTRYPTRNPTTPSPTTRRPTPLPTTPEPTRNPTWSPSVSPTLHPTPSPTEFPTWSPTDSPTTFPTAMPTVPATDQPTNPTPSPTNPAWHIAQLGANLCDYGDPPQDAESCKQAALAALPLNRRPTTSDREAHPNWQTVPPRGYQSIHVVRMPKAPGGCSLRYNPGSTEITEIQQWDAVWNTEEFGMNDGNFVPVCAGRSSETAEPTGAPTSKQSVSPS